MTIDDVMNYILNHYKDVTLLALSDHFSYTSCSMIRFIKKYTYRTFKDILKQVKLSNVITLLKDTNDSIEEIAEKTGFSDRAYLDRVFKSTYHITPKQYRENEINI